MKKNIKLIMATALSTIVVIILGFMAVSAYENNAIWVNVELPFYVNVNPSTSITFDARCEILDATVESVPLENYLANPPYDSRDNLFNSETSTIELTEDKKKFKVNYITEPTQENVPIAFMAYNYGSPLFVYRTNVNVKIHRRDLSDFIDAMNTATRGDSSKEWKGNYDKQSKTLSYKHYMYFRLQSPFVMEQFSSHLEIDDIGVGIKEVEKIIAEANASVKKLYFEESGIEQFTKELIEPGDSTDEKAGKAYNWIVSNIAFDERYDLNISSSNTMEYMANSNKASCKGRYIYFKTLLDILGIENRAVTGYVEDKEQFHIYLEYYSPETDSWKAFESSENMKVIPVVEPIIAEVTS